MRIHQLEVTAFGPFSGTERVDFDDLSAAGLFLLCGPTGAGKTSILDAVCFGLYGEVPGDRNSAKRLRSDHAAAGTAPSVALELSISGRRFRIRRSPAWQRPKRRGTGTTTEQARVNLEELVDGEWSHLSNRLDETGHLLTELLGMNVTQFTQVAMLPQGRFQAFLRAKSDERHRVLQRLFRTARFEDVERWLVAHRQSLKAANRVHQESVAAVVSRLSEAAGKDLPDSWDAADLAGPADAGEVGRWATALVAEASSAHTRHREELEMRADHLAAARRALDATQRLLELRGRHLRAVESSRCLAEGEPEAAEARERLAAAQRSRTVAPLVRVARDADLGAAATRRDLRRALAAAADLLGREPEQVTVEALGTAERDALEAATTARALLPREAELREAERLLASADAALGALEAEDTRLAEQSDRLPREVESLRAELDAQSRAAAELPALEEQERRLRSRLGAAEQARVIRADLATAREELAQRVDVAQTLREAMHDIREARINGMAAELAAALVSGHSCPVCGSADHPAAASPVAGAPGQADEDAARVAYENADFVRQAQAEAVSTLQRNLAVRDQAAEGASVEILRPEIDRATERVQVARAAETALGGLVERLEETERQLTEVRRRSTEARAERVRLAERRTRARDTVTKVTAELSALFAEEPFSAGVQRLIDVRTAAGAVFAKAREALLAAQAATARSEEAARQAAECAAEHGFASVQEAVDAALETAEQERLDQLLRTREELRARVDAVLRDPDVRAAVDGDDPDLDEHERAAARTEEAHADCAGRVRVAEARVARLTRLCAEVGADLAAWAPTRSAYAVACAISTFAEGKGGDNTLQMRLSAYVLAERLKQVVAAANERLHVMSDERYTLEHSVTRGAGELRGGLSLQVRDEWTGEARDPATLSGGETFVASLALALGLADVVTQEVGGAGIDTLFIDEGFGSLDPETLDDVMNTLDTLRDGGRVVGIVSHVPEMRTRVTAQLQVRKDRSGSRVQTARELV